MRKWNWRLAGLSGFVLVILMVTITLAPVVTAAPLLQFSPTPAPVVLPSASPTVEVLVTATATRTATPVGPALAEALVEGTNVRAGPDIAAERLGQINPGTTYPIMGRAEGTRWYRIQFPDAPNGIAWVYEEVVSISGNVDAIPEIKTSTLPTVDVGRAQATQTIEALAQTPGALETATAAAGIAGVVVTGGPALPTSTLAPLPTFTAPAGPVVQATTFIPQTTQTSDNGSDLPPIIPIIGLGVLGGLGLLISILRRIR